MNELKPDIESQIAKTNKAFLSFRGKLFYDGLLDNEIESLEIALRKITRQFNGYRIISIIVYVLLITISMLNFLDIIELGKMIRQTENVQAGRQIRFTNVREIVELEATLKAYIYEAIEVEKAGLKVSFEKITEYIIPDEF